MEAESGRYVQRDLDLTGGLGYIVLLWDLDSTDLHGQKDVLSTWLGLGEIYLRVIHGMNFDDRCDEI
jgi:hypothetical protein